MSGHRTRAFAAALLLVLCGAGAKAASFYLGAWTIASVEPGVWAHGYYDADKFAALRKLVGARIVFGPGSVEGPAPVACKRVRYYFDGTTAHDLFDGRLDGVMLPAGALADDSDPTGNYYAAEKLAARYGFRGFSWKILGTGCGASDGVKIYFAGAGAAALRIDDFVLAIKRP